jgi:hypothetical protein
MNIDDFKVSNGWLEGFKKCHNIVCLAVCSDTQIGEQEVTTWLQCNKCVLSALVL